MQSSLLKKRKFLIIFILAVFFTFIGFYIVTNNESFYKRNIARIVSISEKSINGTDSNGNTEKVINQNITAVIMNGSHKGEKINLQNSISYSKVNDLNLKLKDEIFVSINVNKNNKIISSKILDFKRDKYLFYIVVIFLALIIIVGGLKGFRSLISLAVNTAIFFIVIELFLNNFSLPFIFIISIMMFIPLSMFIVCGLNKKTLSSTIAAIISTVITMLIAIIIININGSKGVHFEELEFLTHPPEKIFYIELLIGTLGGIMDIAISISAPITEIYIKNPDIEKKSLIKSGMEIGKDIMGTMSNTLIFAYMSGSIPTILLLLRNKLPIYNIFGEYLSLEIMRALTGSIGIVLSIPISIFITVILLKNEEIK